MPFGRKRISLLFHNLLSHVQHAFYTFLGLCDKTVRITPLHNAKIYVFKNMFEWGGGSLDFNTSKYMEQNNICVVRMYMFCIRFVFRDV